jgi:hypothetical protein
MPLLGSSASQNIKSFLQVLGAYFAGGYNGSYNSNIDKITFTADTKSTLSATLSALAADGAGAANSGVAAYFVGGDNAGGLLSAIDKLIFAGDK